MAVQMVAGKKYLDRESLERLRAQVRVLEEDEREQQICTIQFWFLYGIRTGKHEKFNELYRRYRQTLMASRVLGDAETEREWKETLDLECQRVLTRVAYPA